MPSLLLIIETRPLLDVTADNQDASKGCKEATEAEDSAFEDWNNCSRTTPVNHKSIRKWRQKSGNSTYSSNSIQPISIMTATSPLEANGGPLSAPSGLQAWQQNRPSSAGFSSPNESLFTSPASSHSGDSSGLKRRMKSETMTSPDSVSSIEDSKACIPVGIAVARQRSIVTSTASEAVVSEPVNKSLEDSGIEMKRPLPPPPPPPRPPTSSEQAAFVESWLRQPQLWPLSYPAAAISGYQFVKDPLTGQMFFVPGFGTPHHLSTASIWPPPPAAHASTAASAAAAFASLTPFQQSLMQLQQESLMVRQGFLFNQPQPHSPEATRPTAPPPVPVEPPEVKVNGALEAEEEQLSVGDEAEDVKIKVKIEAEKSETEAENNGLHLLTEGIDRLEATGTVQPKIEQKSPRENSSRLGMLCDAAFLSDDEHHLKSDDQRGRGQSDSLKVRSRSLDTKERRLSSDYRSPKAERTAKAFIASKSLKVCEDLRDIETSSRPRQHPQQPLKMDDWERKMRSDLASIQKKYKEKYKELYKLQHKSASGSPNKKVVQSPNHSASAASASTASTASNKVNAVKKKTLAPISPWLQTFKLKINGQQQNSSKIEPMPKIIPETSTTPNGNGPDLSVITSKFRSARPNPFENLLKLSGSKKSSDVNHKIDDIDDDLEDLEDKPLMTSTPKVAASNNSLKKKEAYLLANDLNGGHKTLPKLHLANNNKILDEDPEAVEADISDEEDDEDLDLEAPPILEPMQEPPVKTASKQPQNNITVKIKRPLSPATATLLQPPRPRSSCSSPKAKKSKKEKKAKKADRKEKHRHHRDHHHKKHHKKIVVSDDSKAPPDCIEDLLPKTMNNTSTGSNGLDRILEMPVKKQPLKIKGKQLFQNRPKLGHDRISRRHTIESINDQNLFNVMKLISTKPIKTVDIMLMRLSQSIFGLIRSIVEFGLDSFSCRSFDHFLSIFGLIWSIVEFGLG